MIVTVDFTEDERYFNRDKFSFVINLAGIQTLNVPALYKYALQKTIPLLREEISLGRCKLTVKMYKFSYWSPGGWVHIWRPFDANHATLPKLQKFINTHYQMQFHVYYHITMPRGIRRYPSSPSLN